MIYEVRNIESDYWKRIDAIDEEHAAELWAHWTDSSGADYLIVGGKDEPTVEVKDKDGNLTRWTVSGESVPEYRAVRATLDRHIADGN